LKQDLLHLAVLQVVQLPHSILGSLDQVHDHCGWPFPKHKAVLGEEDTEACCKLPTVPFPHGSGHSSCLRHSPGTHIQHWWMPACLSTSSPTVIFFIIQTLLPRQSLVLHVWLTAKTVRRSGF
jgi:hypothetical protein